MKLKWLLLVSLGLFLSNCSDDDDGAGTGAEVATGIPDNSKAGKTPLVSPEESNVSIPNVGFNVEKLNGYDVVNMNMTGIYDKAKGEWLTLSGTGAGGQNIWLEIDGIPRSIKAESTAETRAKAKAQADLVFLVDNSGSMYEEADLLATEIMAWSQSLSSQLDLHLGCVGYDGGYISGGIDLGTYNLLDNFLNREYMTGTSRTYGFEGANAEALETEANNYDTSGECGAAALHFADKNFTFRPGSNRIYVNFTDEPNQPDREKKYSVETVKEQKDWAVWQGTIHTVFSGGEYYLDEEYAEYMWSEYDEKPWLLSDYTGGTSILDAPSDFQGVTLASLPITGALTNSSNVVFYYTPDLATGTHTVKIVVLSPDGSAKAVREFIDVDFSR